VNPTQTILTKVSTLLGADTATLAGIIAVHLVKTAFTPSPTLTLALADEATFPGYAQVEVDAATRPSAFDPATGDRLITITPNTDPFIWETTGDVDPSQTIYGFAIGSGTTALGTTTLLAAELFDTPIELNGIDQQITINNPQFRILPSGIV